MSDLGIYTTVRLRPLNSKEVAEDAAMLSPGSDPSTSSSWAFNDATIVDEEYANGRRAYAFDRVFSPTSTNGEVYAQCAQRVVNMALLGFNGTVFAYGQTGSGKTYSMLGTGRDPGIVPRAVHDVFKHIEAKQQRSTSNNSSLSEFLVRVSYLEVYNEEINDLLQPVGRGKGRNLKILRDDPVKGAVIEGLIEEIVVSREQVLEVIARGEANRHYGATNVHSGSSRSHTIFRMVIESKTVPNAPFSEDGNDTLDGVADSGVKVSFLNLVDLAGSERQDSAGTSGERLREGGFINKSLSALALVISKLGEQAKRDARNAERSERSSLGGGAGGIIESDVIGSSNSSIDGNDNDVEAAGDFLSPRRLKRAGSISGASSSSSGSATPRVSLSAATPRTTGTASRSVPASTSVSSSSLPTAAAQGIQHDFVPYRNSKLTRLLRQSLGGNALTAVLFTITLGRSSKEESVSTLKFGEACKTIRNKAVCNTLVDDKTLLRQYRQKINELKSNISVYEKAQHAAQAQAQAALALLAVHSEPDASAVIAAAQSSDALSMLSPLIQRAAAAQAAMKTPHANKRPQSNTSASSIDTSIVAANKSESSYLSQTLLSSHVAPNKENLSEFGLSDSPTSAPASASLSPSGLAASSKDILNNSPRSQTLAIALAEIEASRARAFELENTVARLQAFIIGGGTSSTPKKKTEGLPATSPSTDPTTVLTDRFENADKWKLSSDSTVPNRRIIGRGLSSRSVPPPTTTLTLSPTASHMASEVVGALRAARQRLRDSTSTPNSGVSASVPINESALSPTIDINTNIPQIESSSSSRKTQKHDESHLQVAALSAAEARLREAEDLLQSQRKRHEFELAQIRDRMDASHTDAIEALRKKYKDEIYTLEERLRDASPDYVELGELREEVTRLRCDIADAGKAVDEAARKEARAIKSDKWAAEAEARLVGIEEREKSLFEREVEVEKLRDRLNERERALETVVVSLEKSKVEINEMRLRAEADSAAAQDEAQRGLDQLRSALEEQSRASNQDRNDAASKLAAFAQADEALADRAATLDARELSFQQAAKEHAAATMIQSIARADIAKRLASRLREVESREARVIGSEKISAVREANVKSVEARQAVEQARIDKKGTELLIEAAACESKLEAILERENVVAKRESEVLVAESRLEDYALNLQAREDVLSRQSAILDDRAQQLDTRETELDDRIRSSQALEAQAESRSALAITRATRLAEEADESMRRALSAAAEADSRSAVLDARAEALSTAHAEYNRQLEAMNLVMQDLEAREKDAKQASIDLERREIDLLAQVSDFDNRLENETSEISRRERDALLRVEAAELASIQRVEETARAAQARAEEIDAREAELARKYDVAAAAVGAAEHQAHARVQEHERQFAEQFSKADDVLAERMRAAESMYSAKIALAEAEVSRRFAAVEAKERELFIEASKIVSDAERRRDDIFAEVDLMRSTLSQELEREKSILHSELNRLRSEAEAEARSIRETAQSDAIKREESSKASLNLTKREASLLKDKLRAEAEQEALSISRQAHSAASMLLSTAESDGAALQARAREAAAAEAAATHRRANRVADELADEAREELTRARSEAVAIANEARAEAAAIKERAIADARNIETETQRRVAEAERAAAATIHAQLSEAAARGLTQAETTLSAAQEQAKALRSEGEKQLLLASEYAKDQSEQFEREKRKIMAELERRSASLDAREALVNSRASAVAEATGAVDDERSAASANRIALEREADSLRLERAQVNELQARLAAEMRALHDDRIHLEERAKKLDNNELEASSAHRSMRRELDDMRARAANEANEMRARVQAEADRILESARVRELAVASREKEIANSLTAAAGPAMEAEKRQRAAKDDIDKREAAIAKQRRTLENAAQVVAKADADISAREARLAVKEASLANRDASFLQQQRMSTTSAAAELVLSNVTQQAQTLAKTLLALRETGAVTPAQLQIAVKSATIGTGSGILPPALSAIFGSVNSATFAASSGHSHEANTTTLNDSMYSQRLNNSLDYTMGGGVARSFMSSSFVPVVSVNPTLETEEGGGGGRGFGDMSVVGRRNSDAQEKPPRKNAPK